MIRYILKKNDIYIYVMKYQIKYQIYIYTQSIYTIIPTTFFLFRKKLESPTTKPPGGAFARCLLLQQRDQGALAEWSLQSLQGID